MHVVAVVFWLVSWLLMFALGSAYGKSLQKKISEEKKDLAARVSREDEALKKDLWKHV